ncbi:hypothetical protein LUZ60_014654 [Juncus effusus]|nr:hypothetical protein LUZ60_014654 [Juncus effusus]
MVHLSLVITSFTHRAVSSNEPDALCLFRPPQGHDRGSKGSQNHRDYVHAILLEEAFKKCSKGKPFFGGDTISFLDVTLGCYLAWFKTVEKLCEHKFLDETKFPELVEWAERFLSADCAKEVTPEVQKIEEYITVIKGRWAAAASSS